MLEDSNFVESFVETTKKIIKNCRRVEYIDFTRDGRLMVTGHEDSGLLSVNLIWSKLTGEDDYDKLQKEILNNKDLQK